MKRHLLLGLTLLLFCSTTAFGQRSKETLEREIAALQREIATANLLLKENKKNKQVTLNQVSILDKKIQQRQQLIKTYKQQIDVLDNSINDGQVHIKTLQADLKKLRKEYAQMVVFANKNRSHYDKLGFLFASKDFNQAYSRLRYIRQFNDARKEKMNKIAATEKQVSEEVLSCQTARNRQAELLKDEKVQQGTLQKEKDVLNTQVSALKKEGNRIQQTIKQKQQEQQRLQKLVEQIIAEEIRKANETKGKKGEGKSMALTPAEKKLSSGFSSNKGALPWPAERGMIASTFGKHEHPVSSKVTVTNNGIDIATPAHAKARTVFEGLVVSVNKLTTTNNAVIIRHGDYFTVYSNLEEVYVKRGDKVKTKQDIGRIHTDQAEGKTELHFELWHGREKTNPAPWLAR